MADTGSTVSEPLESEPMGRRPLVQAVADPAPLGLAAFAMTTFALSISNTNIWPAGADAALALALVYGGAAQLFAGMWEFARRNTFGALAFTSFGAFWISYYVFVKFVAPGIKTPDDAAVATGVFLLGWTIFTFYMIFASLRVSGAVVAVFVLLTVDLRAAHHRGLQLVDGRRQGRWLARVGHCRGRVVHVLRRRGKRDVQEDRHPAPALWRPKS